MCLAVPFKIIELNGKDAIGDRNGIRRKIRVDFIKNPQIGDNVLIHAGFAIERISDEQAGPLYEAASEVEDKLRALMEG